MPFNCSRSATLIRARVNASLSQYPAKAASRRARWSSVSQQPGSDQYATTTSQYLNVLTLVSVHFPGAVNSKFTTKLSFERPSTHSTIPTYRVMDSDGVVVDKARTLAAVSDEEVLTWYKNMVTGAFSSAWKKGDYLVRNEC